MQRFKLTAAYIFTLEIFKYSYFLKKRNNFFKRVHLSSFMFYIIGLLEQTIAVAMSLEAYNLQ